MFEPFDRLRHRCAPFDSYGGGAGSKLYVGDSVADLQNLLDYAAAPSNRYSGMVPVDGE